MVEPQLYSEWPCCFGFDRHTKGCFVVLAWSSTKYALTVGQPQHVVAELHDGCALLMTHAASYTWLVPQTSKQGIRSLICSRRELQLLRALLLRNSRRMQPTAWQAKHLPLGPDSPWLASFVTPVYPESLGDSQIFLDAITKPDVMQRVAREAARRGPLLNRLCAEAAAAAADQRAAQPAAAGMCLGLVVPLMVWPQQVQPHSLLPGPAQARAAGCVAPRLVTGSLCFAAAAAKRRRTGTVQGTVREQTGAGTSAHVKLGPLAELNSIVERVLSWFYWALTHLQCMGVCWRCRACKGYGGQSCLCGLGATVFMCCGQRQVCLT